MTQMASRSPSGLCPWAPSSPSHLWTTPLLVAALACGGSGAGESAGSGDEPAVSEGRIAIPTSGLTPELLADSVLSRRPGAHEIPLHELGFQYGSPEAPISVVEFSDYGCGYCRRFQVETFPTLLTDFIEQGRVKWRYVTYLSGAFPKSLPAAMVAECAGEQGLFRARQPSDLRTSEAVAAGRGSDCGGHGAGDRGWRRRGRDRGLRLRTATPGPPPGRHRRRQAPRSARDALLPHRGRPDRGSPAAGVVGQDPHCRRGRDRERGGRRVLTGASPPSTTSKSSS